MPPRSELPGELSRTKFLRALVRLGFVIDPTGGDGSHCKIVWPGSGKSITCPQELRKDVLYYVLKEIETKFEVSWEAIKKEL